MLKQLSKFERTSKVLILGFVALMAVSLVLFFRPGGGTSALEPTKSSEVIASVGGDDVTLGEFATQKQNIQQQFSRFGGQISLSQMGFSDDKIRQLCQESLSQGWTGFKLKVGGDPADDLRRARLMRAEIGPHNKLMMDANQKWGVTEAIQRTKELAEVDPWWMEEPTSPDDILGHARIRREASPVRIATGEHCHNRVMFKQFMQAGAIDVCQIDSCRVAGVNENLAVLLMAAKFNIPVCPHAGGVGLCECVQHLAIFDYLRVSASLENRVTEFVDHLHEHFADPARVVKGHYLLPREPGYSTQILPETLLANRYPDGPVWKE